MIRPITLLVLIAATVPFAGMCEVRPAALFSDNMVIQRETQAPVWGFADAGEAVTVRASWGASASTTADQDGNWMVKLKTPSAGGPHTMTIQGNNTIEIANVLSGEVWFCPGQSNMEFKMSQLARNIPRRTAERDKPAALYIKNEIETAEDYLLRQFTVTKNTSPLEPFDTLTGSWILSSPEANGEFSATAYFFGRELRERLDVPVALIASAWGGTRVEAWMPAEVFEQDQEMAAYYESKMAELRGQLEQWDDAKVAANYQEKLKKWEAGGKKRRKPKPARHPTGNQDLPATLFNAMVTPVIPYAIKGAIWYQGEANAKHNTHKYEANFRGMIRAWREHWGQGDFPFYFAQLAAWQEPTQKPVESNKWVSICDQQRRALGLNNTGMAVLSDIGEASDIHPHNKMDVGKRLALWALKNDYQQALPVCSGPLYKSHTINGNQVVITFDSVGSGLMSGVKPVIGDTTPSSGPLKHFQICGADRKWKWAEADITGKDQVTVSHPEVNAPTVVRYAWAQNASSANLYNKEGLPASIFTTEE